MGKKKCKDWQYRKATKDPGLMIAVQNAAFQRRERERVARMLIVEEECVKAADEHRDEVEDEFTDWLFGCFALVMHRKYGFGARRIARLFDDMQEMRKELVAEGIEHRMIWDMIRDEIGLDITTT